MLLRDEVKHLLYQKEGSRKHAKVEDIEFYQKQFRIVLRTVDLLIPKILMNISPVKGTLL